MKVTLIPERLSNSRKKMNITKLEASKRMNIGQATYVRYENGDRNPTYATIIRMAQVLEVSPEYLIGETDKCDPEIFIVKKEDNPEMYDLIKAIQKINPEKINRLFEYIKAFLDNKE